MLSQNCQKGLLRRPELLRGLPRGMRYFPRRRTRPGDPIREHSCGRMTRRSGTRKSKILCLPGLQPVWKEDHATGDSAGSVVPKRRKHPRWRSLEKFGSSPSSMSCSVRSGSWPSSPTMTTRLTRGRALFPRRTKRLIEPAQGPHRHTDQRQEEGTPEKGEDRDKGKPGARAHISGGGRHPQ